VVALTRSALQAYDAACKLAVDYLQTISDTVERQGTDVEPLIKAAMTALGRAMGSGIVTDVVVRIAGSKIVNKHCKQFAEICVRAVLAVGDLVSIS
jgi:chaperonin GroEL (HSP60 family)